MKNSSPQRGKLFNSIASLSPSSALFDQREGYTGRQDTAAELMDSQHIVSGNADKVMNVQPEDR